MKHNTLASLFSDCADAIRERTHSLEPVVADDLPEEILNVGKADILSEPDDGLKFAQETATSYAKSIEANSTVTESYNITDGKNNIPFNASIKSIVFLMDLPYLSGGVAKSIAFSLIPGKTIVYNYIDGAVSCEISVKAELYFYTYWRIYVTIDNKSSRKLQYTTKHTTCCIYS